MPNPNLRSGEHQRKDERSAAKQCHAACNSCSDGAMVPVGGRQIQPHDLGGGYDLSPDFLPRLLKEQIDNMRGIARKNNLPLLAILEIGTAALDLLGKSPDDIDDDVYRRFDAIRDQHLITNTELGDILYDLVSVFK